MLISLMIFIANLYSIKIIFCYISIPELEITTTFWTCHDSTTIMACAKLCSDHLTMTRIIQTILTSNSNHNLQSISELAPGIGQYLWYPEEISADDLPTFSASVFTNPIPWQQLLSVLWANVDHSLLLTAYTHNQYLWLATVLSFQLIFTMTRTCFQSLGLSKLRLCSANHRAGYFSNLALK